MILSNNTTFYWIGIIATALIYVVCARELALRSFKRGMQRGSKMAVEWLVIALAESGFKGKQLTDLLTLIAAHLQNLNDAQDEPGTTEKGEES